MKWYLNLRLSLAVGTPQPKLQCRAVPHLHLLDVNSAEAAVPELLWALLWLQERGTGMAMRAQRCISQPVSSWWAVLIHFQAHLRGDDWVSILDLQNFKHHFTHIRDFVYRQNMDYGCLLSQQERKSFAVKIIYCTEDLFNNKNKNKSISQLNCKLSLKLVELIVVKYINNWSGEQSLNRIGHQQFLLWILLPEIKNSHFTCSVYSSLLFLSPSLWVSHHCSHCPHFCHQLCSMTGQTGSRTCALSPSSA